MTEKKTKEPNAPVFLALLFITVVVGFLVRRPLADDAFITFRYAANLLDGHGLVYNPGERVLGLSTPLWGLILAGLKVVGIPYHISALVGGALGFALALFVVFRAVVLPIGGLSYTALVVPLTFLSTMVVATAFSGMETGLYLLAVFAALDSLERKRLMRSAVLAGVATLFRPDGAVCFAVIALFVLLRSPRRIFAVGLAYGVVVAPWVLFAWSYYGWPAPHSVAAKQVLHPSTPLMNLQIVSELFARTPADFVVSVLGISGMLFLLLRGRCVPYVLWCGLYVTGILFSGLKPIFYWYFAPIWFVLLTVGTAGVGLWLRERTETGKGEDVQVLGRIAQLYLPLVSLLVVGSSLYQIMSPDEAVERDNTYRRIGEEYAQKIQPGEQVYVGETGLLGFSFLHARILDSSGINSMQAYRARKKARDRLTELGTRFKNMSIHSSWSLELVQQEKPDWIISPRGWCQMQIMEDEPWFQQDYTRLEVRYPEHLHGIGIYRKNRSDG